MFQTLNYFQMITLMFIFIMNFYSLYLFFIDKKRSQKKAYRISEKQLLLSAFLFGGIGAWIGMTNFRHKTKKPLFKICIPLAAIWTLISMLVAVFYTYLF
ncbi:DUF1294 domain-containing protein [Marinilactibacillus kalidii]|uniref:DUF1294 domain-containing protein n=1 Tax=Marinilactibacillus kalidii TaxID=2820274 RepID=UPI001ABDA485|nr:DUF1294 domain-containing protein [Marinilactibacillus kalidii]